jgi:hypothetical protein
MAERQADDRSLHFAGDIDDAGRPLPMTYAVLEARAARWPVSSDTPEGVASLLARSRQAFADGYYTYENFADAAAKSLQAVEAALRYRLEASQNPNLAKLIKRAHHLGLVDDDAQDILDTGRELRNRQFHATAQPIWNPALAAEVIRTSHRLVADLFEPADD